MTAILAGLLAAAPAPGQTRRIRPTASQRMALYLRHVADDADPVVNAYLNRARAVGIRTLLVQTLPAGKEINLRVKIVEELIKAGQFREAIADLGVVEDAIEGRRIPVPAGFQHTLRDLYAIAYLRVGEQESGRRPAHGWIAPMDRPGGKPFDAYVRQAIDYYTKNLDETPDDLGARWLLNVAWMAVGEYPEGVPEAWRIPPDAFASPHQVGRFRNVAARAGVAVTGHAGGSIMEDFDGDGLLDLMVSSRGLRDQLRYFHNEADGTFSDRTAAAGLLGQLGGLNLSHADYDNDGDRDVVVWRGAWMGEAGRHPNSLLRNDGKGLFDDATYEAGLLSFHPTHSGVWGDYDNDGWLDLFVGNESSPAPKPPHPNQLYHSNGAAGTGVVTFADVASAAGVKTVSFVKGTAWGDIDNDGDLDLYVSNLNGDNVLFRNDGDGATPRFTDVTDAAGVAEPYVSFPTWFWDYDNDGWQDLLVAGFDMTDLGDMAAIYLGRPFTAGRPRLYHNRGGGAGAPGTFDDVAHALGLDRVILPMGANYGDIDNDGWLDAYFGTGMPDMRALLPDRMLRNDGGHRFQDVTTAGGFGFLQKGHGISFGDIDNDGDQDIYHVLGAAFEGDVYENVLLENPGHGNDWLVLYLEGVRSNRDAIGARVRVCVRTEAGDRRDIHVTVSSGGSFGSSPLRREIGLGRAAAVDTVAVRWPAGTVQRFQGLRPDRAYRIREGEDVVVEVSRRRFDLSP